MRGFTLVELLAALAVLSVGLGVASLALGALRLAPGSETVKALVAARAEAVRAGRPVVWRKGTLVVRFLPDGSSSGGRVLLDSVEVDVDPLTGAARAGR